MKLKIKALSDLHGYLPDIKEECDLVLISGDICPVRDHSINRQYQWLQKEFRAWLKTIPARKIVVIAGNHDFIAEQFDLAPLLPECIYLQDNGVEFEGLHIYGTPWQPTFYNWAFNLDEPDLAKKWALIPENTDILVVHGPPFGYGDMTTRGEPVGSTTQLERLNQLKAKLVVCGHIHGAYGIYEMPNGTKVVNASILNERYEPENKIIDLELESADTTSDQGSGSTSDSPTLQSGQEI